MKQPIFTMDAVMENDFRSMTTPGSTLLTFRPTEAGHPAFTIRRPISDANKMDLGGTYTFAVYEADVQPEPQA